MRGGGGGGGNAFHDLVFPSYGYRRSTGCNCCCKTCNLKSHCFLYVFCQAAAKHLFSFGKLNIRSDSYFTKIDSDPRLVSFGVEEEDQGQRQKGAGATAKNI